MNDTKPTTHRNKLAMLKIDPTFVEDLFVKQKSGLISEDEQIVLANMEIAYRCAEDHFKPLAVLEFMKQTGFTKAVSVRYIETAMAMYNMSRPIDKRFLENWTLRKLQGIVNSPTSETKDVVKALATILKHVEQMPEAQVDPKLRESNVVGVIFQAPGMSEKILTEGVIQGLDMQTRQTLLDNMNKEITPERAAEIMGVKYVPVEDADYTEE